MIITGTILNRENQPIAGATIEELESGKQTISNTNGGFSLDVLSLNSTLEVTHISYKSNYVFASESTKITLGNQQHNLDTLELDFTRKKPFNGLYVVALAAITGIIYLATRKKPKKVTI